MKRIASYIVLIFAAGLVMAQYSLPRLSNAQDFKTLAGLPLSAKYGEVSAVKVVYDLKTKELHFINSKHFRYHYQFCKHHYEPEMLLTEFNKINYEDNPKRRYLLGNINHFRALNIYALEFSPVDMIPNHLIFKLYDLVVKETFLTNDLQIFVNNARLKNASPSLERKASLLFPSDIYRNLNYQAIAKTKQCGVLKIVTDLKKEQDNLQPEDIIVIRETPLFLPKVSGVLVTEFQTPLSHLSILAQTRNIPIAAYKQAFDNEAILSLENKKVCLQVKADTFQLEHVDHKQPKIEHRKIKLTANLEVDSLIGVQYLDKKSGKYAGNKAANFGQLHQLSLAHNFKVPECAFVIPFHFYDTHVQNSPAGTLIEELLAKHTHLSNDSIRAQLKTIRRAIKAHPIDTGLILGINKRVEACDRFNRFRFRSSTNAEDAKGFSGAGLYTSKTGIYQHEKKTFERAIKKVWASLWNYEAFAERNYFNMDHSQAYMGILVHRSFPNEEANGVAITKNLYRPDTYGFVVNVQKGEESVVKPAPGDICDQFICYPDKVGKIYGGKGTIEIITQSNLNNGDLVMTPGEIQQLANQLEVIKKHFKRITFSSKPYLEFGMDVEFKLDQKSRELYIKQARVFND